MIAMVICRLRLVLKTVYGSLPLLAASGPVTNLPISASTTDVLRIFETASFWEKLKLRDVDYRHAPSRNCRSAPHHYRLKAAERAKNPVSNKTVRQTGDFGRQPLDRRKTPSPTPTGVYRVICVA
jgi:hypothetical protein